MSTTTSAPGEAKYALGDVVLLRVPVNDALEKHARPVLVIRDTKPGETTVAVVPISPDPLLECNTLFVQLGSFEAARMGLVTTAYLNARPAIWVDRQFIIRRIGQAPYRLLQEFNDLYSEPLYLLQNFPAGKYF